jgi:hypothetical protein
MSDVPFLFYVPRALLVAFLSEWLDMPTIGMLDTAMSTKKHRSQFLSSLQSMRSTSVESFYTFSGEFWWWRWLAIRQVFVESIVVHGRAVQSDLVIPSMRNVKIKFCEKYHLLYLVRNCPALRSLDLETNYYFRLKGLGVLANIRKSLEEFSLCTQSTEEFPENSTALIDLFFQCSNLHTVALTGDVLSCVDLAELIPYGHLLRELEFKRTLRPFSYGRAISNLLANCGRLRKLRYVGSDGEQDFLVITALCRSCPLLEDLELSSFSFNRLQHIASADISRIYKFLRVLTLHSCNLPASILRSIAGIGSLKELTFGTCGGLTGASIAVLATMPLESLSFYSLKKFDTASLESFIGSRISQTLEVFSVFNVDQRTLIDDVQVAKALSCCRNLKTLFFKMGVRRCVFGRNGLDGLRAMATGCPLLAEVAISLTVSALYYVATHFTHLTKCRVFNGHAARLSTLYDFPPLEELQTRYPSIKWEYG